MRKDFSGFPWFEGADVPGRMSEHSLQRCLPQISAAPRGSDYSIANIFMITSCSLGREMQRSPLTARSPARCCPVSLAGESSVLAIRAHPAPLALGALCWSEHHTVLVLGYFIPAECSKMVCHLHFFAAVSWRNMLQNAFSKSL